MSKWRLTSSLFIPSGLYGNLLSFCVEGVRPDVDMTPGTRLNA